MLDALLPEVVELILGFLHDKKDLLLVRLVCRQLSLKSFTAFAIAWFNTIEIDLSKKSLHRLNNIAHHETLRRHVCYLRICDYQRDPVERPLGQGIHWRREDTGCLNTSSVIVANFRDWLANKLVRCRSFEVTDTYGRYPERVGTSSSLSPAGAVRLLFAVAAGLPVHTFRINQVRAPSILCPSQISSAIVNSLQFQGSWASHLLELELAWNLEDNHLLRMAMDLIIIARNLRKLRLDWHNSDAAEHFFDHLGQAKTLPPISDLRIKSPGSIMQYTLLTFLSRLSSSIASLDLSCIHLSRGSWRSLFGDLQFSLPHLEQITSCYEQPVRNRTFFCPLRQEPTIQDHGEFEFLEICWKGKRRLAGVRYKGNGLGMRRALSAPEGSVYTINSNGPPSPGISDEKAVRKFDPRKFVFLCRFT
jgi:hypothetical protein